MTFLDAHEAIWLVNFALPLKGFASFTTSKLRLAFPHEAQNFLNHTTFEVGRVMGIIGIIGVIGVIGIIGVIETLP